MCLLWVQNLTQQGHGFDFLHVSLYQLGPVPGLGDVTPTPVHAVVTHTNIDSLPRTGNWAVLNLLSF